MIDFLCCRCVNEIHSVNRAVIYNGSLFCGDCYPEIMPEEWKKVMAAIEEEFEATR